MVNESFSKLVTATDTAPRIKPISLVIRDMSVPVGFLPKNESACLCM